MNVWKKYEGKKVFIRTNKERVYSGYIKEIAEISKDTTFISILRHDGKWATIIASDIVELKEENSTSEQN